MQTPRRGDIIYLDFDPQSGKEQKKRRPALVVSDSKFNRLGLVVVCPITSTEPRHLFHIPLPSGLKTRGCVMSEQVKSLDFKSRSAVFHEAAPVSFTQKVRNVLKAFL